MDRWLASEPGVLTIPPADHPPTPNADTTLEGPRAGTMIYQAALDARDFAAFRGLGALSEAASEAEEIPAAVTPEAPQPFSGSQTFCAATQFGHGGAVRDTRRIKIR